MIVDAHTHIGVERLFNLVMTSEELMATMERFHISKAVVQPQAGAPDIKQNHREIFELAQANPGKIYGLASFNPVTDEEEYRKNAEWAVNELKFRGLKLHTNGFSISPQNPFSRKVFEMGRKLKVPVMIHTGAGVPQALPSLVIPVAREFSDVPIVLAHAGGGMFAGEAIIAAQLCDNIYLETSWVYAADVAAMISAIGADRVMFGSDIFQNIPSHLAIYENLGLSDRDYEKVIGLTAASLFDLK
ncbi:MAG: amidohydrolase family protein [Synergistaceae bacterium]|jgi:predicted TIM-barrel fold metal-dependent hydrolase|nr:amidohydrolase family protein [Synergistaceae bacterium]